MSIAAVHSTMSVSLDVAQPVRERGSGVGERDQAAPYLVVLVCVGLLITVYFVVRYAARWTEHDTSAQSLAIRALLDSATLVPPNGEVYPSGYGYAAVSAAIIALTGLSVATLQQVVYPLLSTLLIIPAWALYRELTQSVRAAALAVLLLFLQPEFLFVVLRGSHERVLRGLMLVSLWLLVRSFRYRDQPRLFAAHVLLFYLAAFGLIATNAFFGMSFVLAIATAMAAAWGVYRLWPSLQSVSVGIAGRFASITAAVTALGFVFVFYLYTPARHLLTAMNGVAEKLLALFLTTRSGTDPYVQVLDGWVSLPVYFLVSFIDYLLLLSSAFIWSRRGLRWLRGQGPSSTPAAWLLWLLFGAFAFQGVLSIVSDRSGMLGSNLQYRSFPSFAMLAAPTIALALSRWRPGRAASVLAVGFLGTLAALALLKATGEPSLANKWFFYSTVELRGLAWADRSNRDSSVWVGPDDRLRAAYAVAVGNSSNKNFWDIAYPKRDTRTFLFSDVVVLSSLRLRIPLPSTAEQQQIYDEGSVQVYRLRAETPYQR